MIQRDNASTETGPSSHGSLRRILRPLTLILLVGVAAVTWNIFSGIEDWSRDFTSNSAKLDPDSELPLRRPFRVNGSVGEATDRIQQWVDAMPRWSVVSVEDNESARTIKLTRTTRLMRFVDDVTVRLEPAGSQTKINAESCSRLGVGDLGQNPRNLEEFVSGVREDR